METTKKITVLLTDDHVLVRQTMSRVLNDSKQFTVVAECSSAEDAIETAKLLHPMVIMMDINLPGINGIEATKRINECLPGTKVLGVSMHANQEYAHRMMSAGAIGYMTKTSTVDEMFEALTNVAGNKKYICKEVVELISSSYISGNDTYALLKSLTKRESDIVSLIYKGFSSKQIAKTLFINERTVSAHRYNIFKKLNVNKNISLINLLNENQVFA